MRFLDGPAVALVVDADRFLSMVVTGMLALIEQAEYVIGLVVAMVVVDDWEV